MIRKFYIGQKIICITPPIYGPYWAKENGIPVIGPQSQEICTVKGFDKNNDVLLFGYDIGEGYDQDEFKPLEELKFPLMTYKKVMEKEEQFISAN